VLFSGHVLPEVEQVADRVGIIRLGRLMHIENMHQRRTLRLVQVRFRGPPPERLPDELQLSLRETNGDAMLYEHRGEAGPLLLWLAQQPVDDLAIGTDDLQAIYRQYHAN
jgi:ABC-2 type transport system ATP-binding protein